MLFPKVRQKQRGASRHPCTPPPSTLGKPQSHLSLAHFVQLTQSGSGPEVLNGTQMCCEVRPAWIPGAAPVTQRGCKRQGLGRPFTAEDADADQQAWL